MSLTAANRGRRIRSLDRIARMAEERLSVWYANYHGPVPAAFIIGMPGRVILDLIRHGMWEYRAAKTLDISPRRR